jgi:hypothetical protein
MWSIISGLWLLHELQRAVKKYKDWDGSMTSPQKIFNLCQSVCIHEPFSSAV